MYTCSGLPIYGRPIMYGDVCNGGRVELTVEILIVAPDLEACARDMMITLNTFAELGLPVAENKLEGPGTCLTFLGIELDAVQLEMRLAREKLLDFQKAMQSWLGKWTYRKKEMESLVGKLSHASKVIQLGKTFLRQLFEVIGGARKSFHHIADQRLWGRAHGPPCSD